MTSTPPPATSEGTAVETTIAPTYDEQDDEIKQHHAPHTSSRGGTKAIHEQQLVCEQVCAADVDEDEEGTPIGVKGMKWETLSVKNLRTICARLGFKGYKNANKVGIIEIIVKCCKTKKVYASLWENDKNATSIGNNGMTTRKEVQCVFRLLNILFSDAFAAEFASIGDVADKQMLDTGKAGNNEMFWEHIQKAFVNAGDNPDYSCLQFMDDEVFCDKEHINPGRIVNHHWKKLRSMWKGVNSDYKAALTRFTLSGTHDSNFFSFCNGKLETYYLRLHLERRPQLSGMVEADLPFECFLASEMSTSEVGDRVRNNQTRSSTSSSDDQHEDSNKKNKTASCSKKRKTEEGDTSNSIAVAIRDYGNSQMKAEVAKQKLMYMQHEDLRRQKKFLRDTWESLSNNIRLLRKDLQQPDDVLDSASRADIEDDIECLIAQKKEVAHELGITKRFD
jgi:hypothetical protein